MQQALVLVLGILIGIAICLIVIEIRRRTASRQYRPADVDLRNLPPPLPSGSTEPPPMTDLSEMSWNDLLAARDRLAQENKKKT